MIAVQFVNLCLISRIIFLNLILQQIDLINLFWYQIVAQSKCVISFENACEWNSLDDQFDEINYVISTHLSHLNKPFLLIPVLNCKLFSIKVSLDVILCLLPFFVVDIIREQFFLNTHNNFNIIINFLIFFFLIFIRKWCYFWVFSLIHLSNNLFKNLPLFDIFHQIDFLRKTFIILEFVYVQIQGFLELGLIIFLRLGLNNLSEIVHELCR